MPKILKKAESKQASSAEREELLLEHVQKIEHDKRLIMYTGVSFFMVLFVGLWFVSFTGAVKAGIPESKTGESLSEVLAKLKENLDKAKDETSQIKDRAAQVVQAIGTSTATTSQVLDIDDMNIEISEKSLDESKEGLKNNESLATSTDEQKLPISQ